MVADGFKTFIERLQSNDRALKSANLLSILKPNDYYDLFEAPADIDSLNNDIASMGRAIQDNTRVKNLHLYLGGNYLVNEVGAISIGRALIRNQSIESVDISTPSFTSNDAVRTVLLALERSKSVKELKISGFYTDPLHNGVSPSPLDDHTVRLVASLLERSSTIERLKLSDNVINDTSVADILCLAVKKNQSLKMLSVVRNSGLGMRGARLLCDAMKGKGKVKIDFEQVKAERVAELISLKSGTIAKVELRCAEEISEANLIHLSEALRKNRSMEEFRLQFLPAYEDGTPPLLPFNSGFAHVISQALRPSSSLRTLSFLSCDIGDEGIEALSNALRRNKTLESLDLGEINVGDTGVATLARAITENDKLPLKEFWLSSNQMGDDGTVAIASLLCNSKTNLQDLDLGCNDFGYRAREAIAEGLKVNKSLKVLQLDIGGYHYLDDIDLRSQLVLVDALRSNQSLEILYVPWMRRGIRRDEEKVLNRALDKALQHNHTIVDLDDFPFAEDIGCRGAELLEANKKGIVAACTLKGLPFPSHLVKGLPDSAIPEAIERTNDLAGLNGVYSLVKQMHTGIVARVEATDPKKRKRKRRRS